VTTDRISDGTNFTCIRTFTPGKAPFVNTRAVLLQRKRLDVPGPTFIFFLASGNTSFQIVVPAPRQDQHLVGKQITFRPIPVFASQDQTLVRGPTRFWRQDLSSPALTAAPSSMVFHFDSAATTKSQDT
jgi:hypothetical protein